MTNQEKFIQVMNDTFNAGFTKENIIRTCSPCGMMKQREYGCSQFKCDKCVDWWSAEYNAAENES